MVWPSSFILISIRRPERQIPNKNKKDKEYTLFPFTVRFSTEFLQTTNQKYKEQPTHFLERIILRTGEAFFIQHPPSGPRGLEDEDEKKGRKNQEKN